MKTKKSTLFTAALLALSLATPALAQENVGTVNYSDVEQLQITLGAHVAIYPVGQGKIDLPLPVVCR